MSRGGARPGAGGKKPKLPPEIKRKNYTIKLSDEEIQLIKRAARLARIGYTTWIRERSIEAAIRINQYLG